MKRKSQKIARTATARGFEHDEIREVIRCCIAVSRRRKFHAKCAVFRTRIRVFVQLRLLLYFFQKLNVTDITFGNYVMPAKLDARIFKKSIQLLCGLEIIL